jgi:hypothetical protein
LLNRGDAELDSANDSQFGRDAAMANFTSRCGLDRLSVLFVLPILSLTVFSGCTLNKALNDRDYSAYGGIWQRADMTEGRVGSVLSDPNLRGVTLDSSMLEATDASGVVETIVTDEAMSEVLEGMEDVVVEEGFTEADAIWTGKVQVTEEGVLSEDAAVIFEDSFEEVEVVDGDGAGGR